MSYDDLFSSWVRNETEGAAREGGTAASPVRVFRLHESRIKSRVEQIEPYLYRGWTAFADAEGTIWIAGRDWAGFTGDALRDRLASGLHFIEEVTPPPFDHCPVHDIVPAGHRCDPTPQALAALELRGER